MLLTIAPSRYRLKLPYTIHEACLWARSRQKMLATWHNIPRRRMLRREWRVSAEWWNSTP